MLTYIMYINSISYGHINAFSIADIGSYKPILSDRPITDCQTFLQQAFKLSKTDFHFSKILARNTFYKFSLTLTLLNIDWL
jgi:hypothetical protein